MVYIVSTIEIYYRSDLFFERQFECYTKEQYQQFLDLEEQYFYMDNDLGEGDVFLDGTAWKIEVITDENVIQSILILKKYIEWRGDCGRVKQCLNEFKEWNEKHKDDEE